MKGKSKKLIQAIVQGFLSGGAGYGVALLGDKAARMIVKDPASQDLASVGGRAAGAVALAYMAQKGKMKKLPVNLHIATVGAAVATGAKALELPMLAPAKAALDKVFAGDEIVIPVRSWQDAAKVSQVMRGELAFAGSPAVAFAGDDVSGKDSEIYDV